MVLLLVLLLVFSWTVAEPGMESQAVQLYPVPGTDSQAAPHQGLAGGRHSGGEVEPAATDGLVALEWNVSTDQVVQEDPQAPHCQLVPVVALLDDPLRGGVDPGALELRVVVRLEKSPAAEVYQLQLAGLEIDEDVLILDVSVDDAGAVAGDNCLNHLSEEVSSNLLVQAPFLTDVVEHVHTVTGMLQYVDEGVVSFEKVQYFHDPLDISHGAEKFKFKWDFLTI